MCRWLVAAWVLVLLTPVFGHAEIHVIDVTPEYLQNNPQEFSIERKVRSDGTIALSITRHLREPQYLVSTLEVRDGDVVLLSSQSACVVSEASTTFEIAVAEKHLVSMSFLLGEGGFNVKDRHARPWLGGTTFRIHLGQFTADEVKKLRVSRP